MTRLRRVLHAQEKLDQPQPDLARLARSLEHVAQINRFLGGNRSVLATIARYHRADELNVLDVGTGSADLPRALVRWARRRKLPIRVRATDVHPQTLELARRACRAYPEIAVEEADALNLPYETGSFTHALMTLTLHHFEGTAASRALQELVRVSRGTAIVSELQRCLPNYWGAQLLAWTWWRSNAITRHDGPLSVLRAFTPAELQELAAAAGLVRVQLRRAFFYRLILLAEPERRAASSTVAT